QAGRSGGPDMLSCNGLHESRISDHIGCKNPGEAAGDAFFGHEVFLSENAAPWVFLSASIRSLLGLDFRNGSFLSKNASTITCSEFLRNNDSSATARSNRTCAK